jgi:omega-hydroxy-beta-dihydromenaquinone-9 sulfotransferase
MPQRLCLTLDAWRCMVRKIDRHRSILNWHTRLSYWLSAATQSLLFRIQHSSHEDDLKAAVPLPPIFLLGFWRSGTTFLHELFSCDPQFGFPSTHACLHPCHFLLTESWVGERTKGQQQRRPMDNMSYSWVSPQEDEFALFALGVPSPYEALLAPSLMRDADLLLDLRRRSQDEKDRSAEVLQCFVRLLTVQQKKPLVLKSPPHGFRLPALRSLFPEARYVIIERNPYEVFASNLKLWQTLLDLYSLESFSRDDIETFVIKAYLIHERIIGDEIRQIDPRSLARVTYEELVANPIGQVQRLYAELALGNFEATRPRIEQHLARVADHVRNRFTLSPAQKVRVESAWGDLIKAKGYSWRADHMTISQDAHNACLDDQ